MDGKIVHLTDLNPPEDMGNESPLEGRFSLSLKFF